MITKGLFCLLMVTSGCLGSYNEPLPQQCIPKIIQETFYATVQQQVPTEIVQYRTQIVPTTYYQAVVRDQYETITSYVNLPQFTTITATINRDLAHTDVKLQRETASQFTTVTNIDVVPTYSVVQAVNTLTVTSTVYQYSTVSSYEPIYVTTTQYATTTVFQDQIVPKFYTETVTVPQLISVCPNQGGPSGVAVGSVGLPDAVSSGDLLLAIHDVHEQGLSSPVDLSFTNQQASLDIPIQNGLYQQPHFRK